MVVSKHPNDCGIVALALYLNRPYEDILRASDHDPLNGVIAPILMRRMGLQPQPLCAKWADWLAVEGIIGLWDGTGEMGHLAVLRHGMVIDARYPDGIPLNDYVLHTRMAIWAWWA